MTPNDLVKQASGKTSDCAIDAKAVTLDQDLGTPSRGLYVGGAGDVTAVMASGSVVTFTALVAGVIHPISVRRVNSGSGTTATGILATY